MDMELVMTKWIAMEATAMLVQEKKEELLRHFPAAFLYAAENLEREMNVREDARALDRFGSDHVLPLGEGGIFTALWKMAEQMASGLEVDLRKIPVRQETIEICEYFDINPYNVLSGGSLLAAAKEGTALAEALTREGIPTVVIGRLTKGNDRILWNEGNKRFLDRPQKDEMYKRKVTGKGEKDERSDFNIY